MRSSLDRVHLEMPRLIGPAFLNGHDECRSWAAAQRLEHGRARTGQIGSVDNSSLQGHDGVPRGIGTEAVLEKQDAGAVVHARLVLGSERGSHHTEEARPCGHRHGRHCTRMNNPKLLWTFPPKS